MAGPAARNEHRQRLARLAKCVWLPADIAEQVKDAGLMLSRLWTALALDG